MPDVTTDMIKELRERTGAGLMDCKKALVEHNGDIEAAITLLREKGLAAAAKKAGRIAAEGLVSSYIHGNGRIGVLLELNCETDFVAKTDEFQALARDICMQIAAANPQYLNREEVPADILEKEKEILRVQALEEGKPEKIIDKIIEGRISKFYTDNCLLDQPFIKDEDGKGLTVADIVTDRVAKMGEKIAIRRFVRYELGEGMEKRKNDFAEEVMSQMK